MLWLVMKIIFEMCINSWACLVGLSFLWSKLTKFLRIVSCRLPSECVFSSALMDVIMTLVAQTINHFVLALLWHICQCINQAYLWIIHMNILCGLHFCLKIMLRSSTKVFTFLSKMTIYMYIYIWCNKTNHEFKVLFSPIAIQRSRWSIKGQNAEFIFWGVKEPKQIIWRNQCPAYLTDWMGFINANNASCWNTGVRKSKGK